MGCDGHHEKEILFSLPERVPIEQAGAYRDTGTHAAQQRRYIAKLDQTTACKSSSKICLPIVPPSQYPLPRGKADINGQPKS